MHFARRLPLIFPWLEANARLLQQKAPPGWEKRFSARGIFYKVCLLGKAAQDTLGRGYIGIRQRVVGGHDVADGLQIVLGQGVGLGGAVFAGKGGGDVFSGHPLVQVVGLVVDIKELEIEPRFQVLVIAAVVLVVTGEIVVAVLGLHADGGQLDLFAVEAAHAQRDVHGGVVLGDKQIRVQAAGGAAEACILVGRVDLPALGVLIVGDGQAGKCRTQLCFRGGVGDCDLGLGRDGRRGKGKGRNTACKKRGGAQAGCAAFEESGQFHKQTPFG